MRACCDQGSGKHHFIEQTGIRIGVSVIRPGQTFPSPAGLVIRLLLVIFRLKKFVVFCFTQSGFLAVACWLLIGILFLHVWLM